MSVAFFISKNLRDAVSLKIKKRGISMLKLIKKLKSKKSGFTLIELIVVIAILGILAAVLVPSILGYVDDANQRAKEANAHNLFSAAQLAYISEVQAGSTPAASDTAYVDQEGTGDAFIEAVKANIPGLEGVDFSVTVGGNGVTKVTYEDVTYPPEGTGGAEDESST